MAKIAFTKLGLTKNQETKIIEWNGQDIEVKQYLPVNDRLELISRVIMSSADDNNFMNPVKMHVFLVIECVQAYTNISLTEKQKEDPCKLYDLIRGNGLWSQISDALPGNTISLLASDVHICADAIYNYRNSVYGILDTITADYSNLNLDATTIQQKLADPENMELLRGVLSKLG